MSVKELKGYPNKMEKEKENNIQDEINRKTITAPKEHPDISDKELEDDLDEDKILFNWIKEGYGERCSDYSEGCACCVAWELYDRLVQKKDLIQKDKEKEMTDEFFKKRCDECATGNYIKNDLIQEARKELSDEIKFLEEQYEIFKDVENNKEESPSVRRVAFLCSKPLKDRINQLKNLKDKEVKIK